MGSIESIHNELTSPIRTQILEYLLESPLKLREIASNFTISKSEISRHLSRLLDVKAIDRDNIEHNYYLTPLGEAYISLSLPVKFILERNAFFESHYIDLPQPLYRSVDNLQRSKFLYTSGDVLTTIQTILDQTKDNLRILLDQKFPLSLKSKINEGKYIISSDILEKGMDYAKKVYERIEVKIYDSINHNLLISDGKTGLICFPSLNHKADITSCFFVSDTIGLEYLFDIWQYYWEMGDYLTL